MSHKNYLNKDNEQLYVLHFPGSGSERQEEILNENLDRSFAISDKLSIVSVMNQEYYDTSPLRKQCDFNNIHIYNSALAETQWSNSKKIGYILESLEQIDTEYVLILDGRDVSIVNNLDDVFISKFESFNYPIIYNGTPFRFPKEGTLFESFQEIYKIKGKQKFLNAGVCVGYKDALIKFYKYADANRIKEPNMSSEQYFIRMTRAQHPELAYYDTDNKIFRIVHRNDTKFIDNGNDVILI